MKSDIEEARKEIEASRINPNNIRDLLSFDVRNANKGLSKNSREAYMRVWYTFALYLDTKAFMDVTTEEIDNYLYRLRQGAFSKKNGKDGKAIPPSPVSINFHCLCLLKLYGMLKSGKKLPPQVKNVKYMRYEKAGISKLQKEDLLTPRDIERMVHAVNNTKWKALIKLGFESGFRVSELLSMTVGSVVFRENEATVKINASKTRERTVLIIDSLPELKTWIQEHPLNNDPKAPLWMSNRGKVMCVRNVQHILKQAAKLAGIQKRVFPHLLRHSIITWRRRMGMVDEEVKMFAGWSEKSGMVEHYSHFNIEDMLNRQRKQSGMPISESDEEKPLKRYEVCPVCERQFPIGHAICDHCHMPLDNKRRIEMLMDVQKQAELMEKMKKAEPALSKILPSLEKIVQNGGLDRLVQVLEKAAEK